MTRCPEGHFYDPQAHTSCPWCAKPVEDPGAAGKTVPLHGGPDPGKTLPMQAAPVPHGLVPGVTQRLVQQPSGVEPVVGWLVCIEGPDKGRDFRVHSEKNFIGRTPAMDICIMNDDAVSREKHATITFEPKKQTFWLVPGESSGLVYLNGEVVHVPTPLKARDVVELGKSKLLLIPFVTEFHRWE